MGSDVLVVVSRELLSVLALSRSALLLALPVRCCWSSLGERELAEGTPKEAASCGCFCRRLLPPADACCCLLFPVPFHIFRN